VIELESYVLAIIAVGGTLLGTFLGAWVNARLARQAEDRRWGRERENRLNEKRLEAYLDYLALAGRMQVWMTVYWAKYPGGIERSSDEYQRLVEHITQHTFEASNRVKLLGTEAVSSVVAQLHIVLLSSLGELTKQQQKDFQDKYVSARADFLKVARADLGIAAGTKM
jgi:hypothetical protein